MTPTAAEAAVKGGKPFTVQLLSGGSETVFVRALGVRDFEKYLLLLDKEPEVAELLCEKKTGWADSVHPDSLGELTLLGEEVNEPFFRPWLKRRIERNPRILRGIQPAK